MKCGVGRVVACAPPSGEERAPRSVGVGWAVCLLVVATIGCKSVSTYISPRVTGRVLAADTRQPIPNVDVRRVNNSANQNYDDPTRGGQRMDARSGTRTDQQGAFVLDAQKDLTLLQQQVWYTVTVAFQREGYVTLRTNFTVLQGTNAPNGVPVVNAGDILLSPVSP